MKAAAAALAEAKKCLATSFTKWKKDYLMAGPAYAKAGTAFRLAKEPARAVDCFLKAAECGEKSGQTFETGKYRELAAQLLRKMPDAASQRRAAELLEQTVTIRLGMEDFIGATDACNKAAQVWSKAEPARAVALQQNAAADAAIGAGGAGPALVGPVHHAAVRPVRPEASINTRPSSTLSG